MAERTQDYNGRSHIVQSSGRSGLHGDAWVSVFCHDYYNDNIKAIIILYCRFKNGSLTRERIRNDAAQGSWQIFNELLESTPRGNFGNFALYYDTQEILPFIIGDYRYNKANDEISRYSSKEVEVRALIEGQCVAKRAYAEDFGFVIGK